MVILNLTRQSIPARNARYAADFRTRLFGLIGKSFSASMDGMVFDRCNGIHTFFMKYPIDVIFTDGKYRVLKTESAFPAWRPWLVCRNAYYVIELPAGKYTVKEVKAPKGFAIDTETYKVKVTSEDETVLETEDVPVTAKIGLLLEKKAEGSAGGGSLMNAVYEAA